MRLLCFSFFFLWGSVTSAQTLNWVWLDFPPAYIKDGPLAGKGIVRRWLPELQRQVLPEMKHQFVEMTPARAWRTMQNDELLCHPASLKSKERSQYAVFSRPWTLVPQKSVILRAGDSSRWFGEQQSISAAELFQRQDLILGLAKDNSFYVHLSPWLSDSHAENHAVRLGSRLALSNLHRMLMSKRIDYMLEYPWVIGYFDKILIQQGRYLRDPIVSLPFREMPQFAKAYISCTNNAEGRRLIEQINHWLEKNINTDQFRAHVGVWLDKESRKRFQQAYQQQIVKSESPE